MNTIPGDVDPLNPSGLRLGTPELTRIGMKEKEMDEIASFYKQILIDKKDPIIVKAAVKEFRNDFQTLHYCFEEDFDGYEYKKLV